MSSQILLGDMAPTRLGLDKHSLALSWQQWRLAKAQQLYVPDPVLGIAQSGSLGITKGTLSKGDKL